MTNNLTEILEQRVWVPGIGQEALRQGLITDLEKAINAYIAEVIGADEKPSEQELHDNWIIYNTRWNLRVEQRKRAGL